MLMGRSLRRKRMRTWRHRTRHCQFRGIRRCAIARGTRGLWMQTVYVEMWCEMRSAKVR